MQNGRITNSLGLNFINLPHIVHNTLVNINILASVGMVVDRRGHHCIQILGVRHLFSTPMPNHLSIEKGILHYVQQEGDATFDIARYF